MKPEQIWEKNIKLGIQAFRVGNAILQMQDPTLSARLCTFSDPAKCRIPHLQSHGIE